jgi:hypothetical protein
VPYLQEGGGDTANSQYEAAGPRLVVEPGKILELKRRLEVRREKVHDFLDQKDTVLTTIPAPGGDPCSDEAVKLLATNGAAAVTAARGFAAELDSVIGQLDHIARDYQLLEEKNAGKLSGPR